MGSMKRAERPQVFLRSLHLSASKMVGTQTRCGRSFREQAWETYFGLRRRTSRISTSMWQTLIGGLMDQMDWESTKQRAMDSQYLGTQWRQAVLLVGSPCQK